LVPIAQRQVVDTAAFSELQRIDGLHVRRNDFERRVHDVVDS
jgi:hypothetical protein